MDDRGVIVTCENCGTKNRMLYERLGVPMRCGACKHDIPPLAAPIDIPSTAAFDALIAHASVPVVVDYWAPWCGPCRMVAPELVKVAAQHQGRLLVVKVNTDVLDDLGARYQIRSIPTMGLFVGGREVARTTGARPAADIEAFVRQSTSPIA